MRGHGKGAAGAVTPTDRFAATPHDWVLSGPHFFVANPFYKTPRKNCNTPLAYDNLVS